MVVHFNFFFNKELRMKELITIAKTGDDEYSAFVFGCDGITYGFYPHQYVQTLSKDKLIEEISKMEIVNKHDIYSGIKYLEPHDSEVFSDLLCSIREWFGKKYRKSDMIDLDVISFLKDENAIEEYLNDTDRGEKTRENIYKIRSFLRNFRHGKFERSFNSISPNSKFKF